MEEKVILDIKNLNLSKIHWNLRKQKTRNTFWKRTISNILVRIVGGYSLLSEKALKLLLFILYAIDTHFHAWSSIIVTDKLQWNKNNILLIFVFYLEKIQSVQFIYNKNLC
jgi:hypothetical protein